MFILAVDPQFDYTKTIWAAIGSSSILTGLIVLVFGTCFQSWLKGKSDRKLEALKAELSKEADLHKSSLKMDGDAELEKLRNKLRQDALTHEIRVRALYENQSEVIGELFRLIQVAVQGLQTYASRCEFQNAADGDQRSKAVADMFSIKAYFDPKRLIFPMILADRVDNLVLQMQNIYQESLQPPTNVLAWGRFVQKVEQQVEPLVRELQFEFRKILGSELGPNTA